MSSTLRWQHWWSRFDYVGHGVATFGSMVLGVGVVGVVICDG